MTPERWQQVREVFEGAVERPPAERAVWLEAAWAADPELRPEVERLLLADDEAGSFFGESVGSETDGSLAGESLGPYRVEEEIGRGGMGMVYLASRADGLFQKKVAVKVVRAGLETRDVLRRFHREREILGRLEHPGIARLLDAGATSAGRPYLVMEHVEGIPLDRWRRERQPALKERLRLFLAVCDAVEHAHRNLVAHRDLKPANILVDAAGRPRLLDFGIAQLLERTENGDPTRAGARAMTPGYASPEQVRGQAVTAASDVWSLGVLLYELLTDRHPFRQTGSSPQEVERAVCEGDAEPPSRAVADVRLRRRLAGDLDSVVLRAIRREPERRYPSVDRLAEDLRRHLEGMPVLARGGGFWYRAGRFARRHKSGVALLVLLVLFGGAMAWLAVQRDGEARRAERIAEFLVESFRLSDPRFKAGAEITAREILRRGVQRVEKELPGEPKIQGTLLETMGRAYLNLGLPAEAEPILKRALAVRRRALGERHPEVAASMDDLARALREEGNWAAAEPLVRRGLRLRRELLGPSHPEVARSLNNLGLVLHEKGEYAAAEKALAEALAIRRRLPLDGRALLGDSLVNLAGAKVMQGKYAGAEPLLREAVGLFQRKLGPEHPNVASSLNSLALIIQRQGRPAEAEPLLRKALRLHRHALGPDHPDVAATLQNLALVVSERGDWVAAEAFSKEALTLHRRRLGEHHPTVALGMNNLAQILHGKGDLTGAEAFFRQSLTLRRELLPAGHPEIGSSLVGLGALLVDRGQAARSEPLLREGLAVRQAALPAGHWRIAAAEAELGGCLLALGDRSGAEDRLARAVPILRSAPGPGHFQTRRAEARLLALRRPPS